MDLVVVRGRLRFPSLQTGLIVFLCQGVVLMAEKASGEGAVPEGKIASADKAATTSRSKAPSVSN